MRKLAIIVLAVPGVAGALIAFAMRPNGSLRRMAVMTAFATLSALVVGTPAWILSLKAAWPPKSRPVFAVAHAVGALAFALTWVWLQYLLDPFRVRDVHAAMITSRAVPWQLITGLFCYLAIVSVAHLIRAEEQRRLEERRIALVQAAAATARFDALRARLQPHFLFNALHTVGVLARESPALAQDAIDQLGEMLRYALAERPSGVVALGQELQFCDQYLQFEQLRLGERLRVHREIDQSSLVCAMPAFGIQTLLENAIRHGIAANPAGGDLSIMVRRETDTIAVKVSDTGAGPLPPARGAERGIGIAALRESLQAFFGPRAGVRLAETPGTGFEVEAIFPARGATDRSDS